MYEMMKEFTSELFVFSYVYRYVSGCGYVHMRGCEIFLLEMENIHTEDVTSTRGQQHVAVWSETSFGSWNFTDDIRSFLDCLQVGRKSLRAGKSWEEERRA